MNPGDTVGPYRVLEKIGEGGMGEVYKARDTRLGREAALKVLPEASLLDADRRERFIREARVVAALNHPNIVTIYGVEERGSAACLAMELVDGRPLSASIPVGGFPPARLLPLSIQLADAVSAAHERGVIHRDLKPANVMVTRDGRVKVLDFGLAKLKEQPAFDATTMAAGHATAEGRIVGTAAYMSPEQAEGKPVDARSDIFSLGIVLFEMATGRPPFQGGSSLAVISAIIRDTPPSASDLNPALPREFSRTIRRCLAKDPEQRYQSAKDLRNDLDELRRETESGASAAAGPVSDTGARPAGTVRPAWWRPVGIAVSAAAVLVVAAASWWSLARQPRTEPAAVKPGHGEAAATATQPRIAVARFDNRTGDASLDEFGAMVQDYLTTGLSRLPGLGAVLATPLAEPEGATKDRAAPAVDPARMLATQTGADTVVAGSYYLTGDTLRVQARTMDIATGKVLDAIDVVSGPRSDPMAVADELRQRILGALSVRVGTTAVNISQRALRPPRYDAYLEFIAGRELFGQGDMPGAIRHLEHASALDPEFPLPAFFAITAYRNLGAYDKAMAIVERSEVRLDRLEAKNRIFLDYARADLEGRATEALARLRELEKLMPGDLIVKWLIAQRALEMNRPGESLQAVEAPLAALMSPATPDLVRSSLASATFPVYTAPAAYHALGRHDEELQVVRQMQAVLPADRSPRAQEARALAALGRVEDLDRLIRETMALPGAGQMAGDVMSVAIPELRAHGHRDAALALAEKAIAWLRALAPNTSTTLAARDALAQALYQAEHWDESRAVYVSLAAERPGNLEYQANLGTLAARLGDRARAERISQTLGQVSGKYLRGDPSYYRARIAAVLGDRHGAVSLLQRAFAEGYRYNLGMHRDLDFESLRDYPPFEELLRPKG